MIDRVSAILTEAGASIVMPRYQALAAGEIEEKGPNDLVTIADREAEQFIEARLRALRPAARVIGEEACARDPALMAGLDDGEIWIIDPIDGTGNFAAGQPPFALMVALLRDGDTVAAWIHDPLGKRMVTAERGAGCWVNGVRARTMDGLPAPFHGIVSQFRTPAEAAPRVAAWRASGIEISQSARCAGHEYPQLVLGERHFALYWRTLVWDHAPGTLILTEAGGIALRPDGRPYRAGEPGDAIVLAANAEIAGRLM